MTIDFSQLWDYNNPALSEQRFRDRLPGASAGDVLLIQTQIARSYSMRGDFAWAQQILGAIQPEIQGAGLEAQTRYYLELGRTYTSAAHPAETQTPVAREQARSAYLRACELAQAGKLDSLAIDALHMLAFVDSAPEEQVAWNRKALALMQVSSQPEAGKWAGSLRNNTGYALYLLGKYEEALLEFELALAAHEHSGNPQSIRIAHWMVAWTLRALNRLDEALEIQLRLEKECDQAGEPDAYVFEELELLYTARNNIEQASRYAARRKAIT
jgi:tetratricopeptide (TPR) repeat protein